MKKAKKQLNDLLEKPLPDVPLASKNAIRRRINKVNSELGIIEKIIGNLKEIYAVNVDYEETERCFLRNEGLEVSPEAPMENKNVRQQLLL